MAEWMYGVVDYCNFRRDIVSPVAMAYLDLLLSIGSDFISTKRTFQLGVITCLYLARINAGEKIVDYPKVCRTALVGSDHFQCQFHRAC